MRIKNISTILSRNSSNPVNTVLIMDHHETWKYTWIDSLMIELVRKQFLLGIWYLILNPVLSIKQYSIQRMLHSKEMRKYLVIEAKMQENQERAMGNAGNPGDNSTLLIFSRSTASLCLQHSLGLCCTNNKSTARRKYGYYAVDPVPER